MKNKKILSQADKYILSTSIISKVYSNIFSLSTPLLLKHYTDVYKELIKRNDYNRTEDLILSYEVIKQELIERGVYNV